MTGKYKSDALASLHGMMADLHEAGGIDKKTMHYFGKKCLAQRDCHSATE